MECSSGGAFVIKLIVLGLCLPSSFGFFPRYRNYPGGVGEADNELANQIMQSRIKNQILQLPLELFEQRQLVQEHVDYENSIAQYKHLENEEVLHDVPFNGNHQDVLIVGNPFRKPELVKNVMVLRRIPGTSLFYMTSVTVRQNPNDDDNKEYKVLLRKGRSKRSPTTEDDAAGRTFDGSPPFSPDGRTFDGSPPFSPDGRTLEKSSTNESSEFESDENVDSAKSAYEIAKSAAKAAAEAAAAALKAAADAEAAFLAANGGRRRKGRKGANEDDTDGDGSLGRTLDGEADGSSGRTLDGEADGSSGKTLDGEADGSSGRTLDGGEPSSEELEGVDYDEPSGMMMGRSLFGPPTGRALSVVPAEDAEVAGRVMDGDDVATEDLQNDKNKKSPGAAGNPKDPGTLELLYGKSADGEPSLLTVTPPDVNTTEIDAAGMERLSEVNKASTQKDAKNAIALAMGVSQNVTANAVSKTGDDAVALATNGSSADALALTLNGAGNAFSGATTHGADGAKSAALNQGNGTSVSSALSKGTGTAKSDALALESNATSGAVAGSGGAVSNAITHKTGHALSQASTSEGGSGKASSVATGVGGSRAGAHSVGGGNSTAVAKSVDGNAESDTVSKDGGAAYSASWAKDQGSSFSNAITYGAAGTRAESLSDGVGTAVAKAYQINTLEDTDSDRHLDMDEVVDGFGVHNGDEFMNDPFFRGRTPGGLSLKDLAGHGDDEIAEFLPGYGRVVEDGSWLAGYTEDGSDVKARKKREADEDDYETAPPDDLKLGEKREADEDDYDTSPPNPSSLKLDDTDTQAVSTKSNNPKGELISNAHAKEGQSLAISMSKMGADATATAINGTGATSVSRTKGRGAAMSRANTHGKEGAKSQSLTTGRGNASSHAVAQGQEGGSETEAIAVGGFAHADSTSVRGTNALSSAQTLKTGDASSKSIALMGGNSSAASVAKGQGNARSNSWADDKGHSKSLSKAKGGNSTANSVGLRDSKSWSVASSQKSGSSLAHALTGIRGTSRADAMTEAGDAVALTVQDSPSETFNIKDFMLKKEIKDFGSSEEVNVEEEDSEEPDTVSDAARKKRHGGYALSKSTSRGFGESYSAASTIKDGNAASYSVSQLDASRADADAEEGSALANAVVDPHINQDPLLSSDGSEAPRGRLLEHEMEDDIASLFCGIC